MGKAAAGDGAVRKEPHTRRREAPFGNYELLLLAICRSRLLPPPGGEACEADAEQRERTRFWHLGEPLLKHGELSVKGAGKVIISNKNLLFHDYLCLRSEFG